MKIEKRYCNTIFTREQVDELQTWLRLKNHDKATAAALAITRALRMCETLIEGRRKVPNVKEAKRRVERIYVTARELRTLLLEEPAVLDLIPPEDLSSDLDDDEVVIDIPAAVEAKRRRHAELMSLLEGVETRALKHATDDDFFRAARWLLPGVPTDDDGAVVASRELWPLLFELWERTVKRPAATENGPTHRFITFVHRVVGLPDPSASTIRDAIKEWRNGNRWSMSAGPPPWWRPGKD